MERICENPNCPNSLEGRKATAKYCGAPCRARASEMRRGERLPVERVQSFWNGFGRVRRPRALSAHG